MLSLMEMSIKKQANTYIHLHTYICKAERECKYGKQWHRLCGTDIEEADLENLD